MIQLRKLTVILSVLFCLPSLAGDPEVDRLEGTSVLNSYSMNWEGLDSYDVVLTSEKFSVSLAGIFKDTVVTHRLIGDYVNERHLFVKHGRYSEESEDGMHTKSREVFEAFYYDKETGEAWRRRIPDPSQSIYVTSTVDALSHSRAPDIRLVGCYDVPRNFSDRFTIREIYQAEFHAGKNIGILNNGENMVTLSVDYPYGPGAGRMQRVFRFDRKRFVPLQITNSIGTDVSERMERKEIFEWEKINEVMVPSRIYGQAIRREQINDKIAFYPESFEARFQWNSVNQKLDTELMNPQVLLDTPRLLSLVGISSEKEDSQSPNN